MFAKLKASLCLILDHKYEPTYVFSYTDKHHVVCYPVSEIKYVCARCRKIKVRRVFIPGLTLEQVKEMGLVP